MAGGGFGNSSDDEMITGINVTPLVDVVLVLLVIFLITAPTIYQSAIHVQLPKAATGEQADASSLKFELDSNGGLKWKDQVLAISELGAKLKSLTDTEKNETASIQADEKTPHGMVIRLMDELRASGITRFAMTVQKI